MTIVLLEALERCNQPRDWVETGNSMMDLASRSDGSCFHSEADSAVASQMSHLAAKHVQASEGVDNPCKGKKQSEREKCQHLKRSSVSNPSILSSSFLSST